MAEPRLAMGRNSFRVTYPRDDGGVANYIEITVEADGALALRVSDGHLVIRPEVSNKIVVTLEKW